VQLHTFKTSIFDGSQNAPAPSSAEKEEPPRTHSTRRWMGPTGGLKTAGGGGGDIFLPVPRISSRFSGRPDAVESL
jgi:hypothetical protein